MRPGGRLVAFDYAVAKGCDGQKQQVDEQLAGVICIVRRRSTWAGLISCMPGQQGSRAVINGASR